MRTLLFILIIFLLGSCSINLKSDKYSTREYINNEWTQFSEWEPIDLKVDFKRKFWVFSKPKLTIHDNKKIVITLKEVVADDTTNDGEKYVSFKCKDNKGVDCLLILLDKGECVNAVIYYKDINYCYNLYEVDKEKTP